MSIKHIRTDDHPVPKNPFVVCSHLLGHADARPVLKCNDNLHSCQAHLFEGITGCQDGGSPCYPMSAPARADPIAKVAEVINGMDMT